MPWNLIRTVTGNINAVYIMKHYFIVTAINQFLKEGLDDVGGLHEDNRLII